MHDLERWRGKVALVTGASTGIGREVAWELGRAGLNVAACARRAEPLEELTRELNMEGASCLGVPCDLRREEDILDLFTRVREHWGGVQVLVNNAGLGYRAPLLERHTERWREMLEVNVLALCVCTAEALADLRQDGGEGHIIHISSLSGHRVPQGSGVYAASKHAVRALTEGLRQELHETGAPIRVTAISPGLVETGFAAHYHQSVEKARETYGRFQVLHAEDVAQAVLFALVSPPHMAVHDILVRPTRQPS
jgi:NADP-dependent 3-hydroxy acid dehydrogenase YdfG